MASLPVISPIEVELDGFEKYIHDTFHRIAEKHKIDPDLVAEIVDEWTNAIEAMVEITNKVKGQTSQ